MAELAHILIAVGPEPDHQVRHRIPAGEVVRIGRAPRHGLRVAWDMMISREHAETWSESGHLHVKCLETARNAILWDGQRCRDIAVGDGESFQIGGTTFRVESASDRRPLENGDSDQREVLDEYAFTTVEVGSVRYGDSDLRLEVLAKLPRVIAEAHDENGLAVRLVALLLQGLPRADAAAVLKFRSVARVDDPVVFQWDSRQPTGRFSPSRRLMQATLMSGASRLHILSDGPDAAAVTMHENLNWAFCVPLRTDDQEAWCLYASGHAITEHGLVNEDILRGDVRFTELLAQFLRSIRQARRLERQQAVLSQFFSPAVMESLTGGNSALLLQPRESDITVLFCDVRGFARAVEESQHKLEDLLQRISRALSVMTQGIVRYDGVIADFQGDTALGFWGWPVAMDDGPLPACRAALYIDDIFEKAVNEADHALADFHVGIGIAHGRAIAGNIGAFELAKVGAFGPVVNLGSRLESLTKQLHVSIVLDEATAHAVRTELPATEGRCRRLARIRPHGMQNAVLVSELLHPHGPHSPLTDLDLADYEQALDLFCAGRWEEAAHRLAYLSPADDAATFLAKHMALHHGRPPQDWDGVVTLTSK